MCETFDQDCIVSMLYWKRFKIWAVKWWKSLWKSRWKRHKVLAMSTGGLKKPWLYEKILHGPEVYACATPLQVITYQWYFCCSVIRKRFSSKSGPAKHSYHLYNNISSHWNAWCLQMRGQSRVRNIILIQIDDQIFFGLILVMVFL